MTTRYAWARRGDINAFFGLMIDNVAVMIFLLTLITNPNLKNHFSRDFVFTQMIPGTALGVVAGDLAYTWLAFRLARRKGRSDVTAMPLGLDTPSTIAVATLVLLPSLDFGIERHYDPYQAMFFAWHVGAVLLVMIGICKSLVAPLGTAVRNWVPRAGLLGSLAGIALALIALVPLWQDIAAVPLVGIVALIVILVTLVADHPLPGRIPGALVAVLLGVAIYWGLALASAEPERAVGADARTPASGRVAIAGVLPDLRQKLVLVAAGIRPCPNALARDVAVRVGDDCGRNRLHGKRCGGR